MFLRRYCNLIELHWTISSSYNQRAQRIIHLLHNMQGFYCMSIFIDFFPVECRYWPNESTCNSLRHGKSWTIKARLAVVFRLFGREYGANFSTNHKVWSKAKSWKLRVILDSQLKTDDLLTYFVPLKKYVHPLCRLVTIYPGCIRTLDCRKTVYLQTRRSEKRESSSIQRSPKSFEWAMSGSTPSGR